MLYRAMMKLLKHMKMHGMSMIMQAIYIMKKS